MDDTFRGDDAHLVRSIEAHLALDAAGALVPHGVGGLARVLLASAAARLSAALARSGQAASGSSQGARSDVPNGVGVGVGQPEAPTAAPLEPFRAALAELVELENLRIRAGTISPAEPGCEKEVLMDEWRRRIRPAWSNARAVLAAHPPARSGAGSEEGQ